MQIGLCPWEVWKLFILAQKQAATASCKTCGGKLLSDGRGALPSSLLGAVSLELTGFICSDLTWKGSKGSRSKTRRAKNSVSRILKAYGKLKSETLDMPVSESEKLGVSVLGCRFSERVEHVPIKKRRFVYRSPSPPPRSPSPHSEENETKRFLNIKRGESDCTASVDDTGQILDKGCDVDDTNLVRVNRQEVENEDFSGISILAAAACSKGFGGEGGHAAESSGVEESFLHEGPFEVSTNNESYSLSRGVSKDDLSSAEMSTEGTSCISAVPQEDIAACLRTGDFSANNLSHRNKVEDNSVQDHTVAVSKDLLTNREEERKQEFSSREVRLHWDLNTAMDSWKHPFDYETNATNDIADDGGHDNCSDKLRNLEGYELQTCFDDTIAGTELPHSDSRDMVHEMKQSNIEEHKSEQENLPSSEPDCAVKMDQFKGKEPLDSQEKISIGGGSVDFVPADNSKRHSAYINYEKSASDHSVSVGCTGTNEGLSSHGVGITVSHIDNNQPFKPNYCPAGNAGIFTSSGSQAEKQEVASVVALSGNSTGEMLGVVNKNVDEAKEISCSSDEINLPKDMDALETGQPLKTGPLDGVTENSVCYFSSGVEMPTSGVLIEAQPASAVDLKEQHDKVHAHDSSKTDDLKVQQDKVYAHYTSEADILLVYNGKESATKCIEKSVELSHTPSVYSNHDDLVNSSDAMALEEPPDNEDVSPDHVQAKLSELEVDYDSQYEDGEVRESIVHAWEEYDGEDMEAEHVDYGSDNASNMGCVAENTMKNTQESNSQPCSSGSSGSAKERQLKGKDVRNEVASGDETGPYKVTGDAGVVAREDDVKKPSVSDSTLKISGWSCRDFSDALTGGREDISKKNLSDDCKDVLDNEDTNARMVRSREFRRELRSCIEGRPLHGAYSKVKTCMQGNSDADNTTPRFEREPEYVESFGRGRYNDDAHARCQGDDHWVNSANGHRSIKHYHSPNYHRPAFFHRSGLENGSIGRHKMGASSFGVHRRLARCGSPVDGEEAFRLQSGFRPSREPGPGRRVTFGRSRSFRYGPRIDGRGPRGRYHRPMPDDFSEPFLNHSQPSTKRERCFSPIERRGEGRAHGSDSKSPSRSGTRSPNSGNPSLRHRSKSPNFKSEVRMQNVRSSHQQPGFLADRTVGYRTMGRSHGSPPHNSRWVGDRKDGGVVHFREQGFNQRSSVLDGRSSGRFGPQDDKFDSVDSLRNYRSMHPGRFSKVDGVGRGRLRCEGSDDNRIRGKHSYKFGLVPPAKRYDIDGDVKRFRKYC
ncbi:hypothetical protein ACOSQ3_025003 [Xanthoceras sorbifolium]